METFLATLFLHFIHIFFLGVFHKAFKTIGKIHEHG